MPIIDIHTHCSPRARGDPFGVAEVLRGTPVGKNAVTNYRGLPAVSYHDMYDFDLQQEVCAKAGITGRIISNPFAAEVISAISSKPAIDVVKYVNDQIAAIVARAPKSNWGLGTLNPLDASHIAEGERCLGALGFKGLLITSSWHGQFIDGEAAFPFWEWAQDAPGAGLHPSAAGADRARPADGSIQARRAGGPAVRHRHGARTHDPVGAVRPLSALEDRGRAHGRRTSAGHRAARFRLAARLRGHARARASSAASSGRATTSPALCVDTMGFWAPHVREAVEVFGVDRVMFGTDYGPVPLDPKEHVDIVNGLAISAADKEKILWRNAARFFNLDAAA